MKYILITLFSLILLASCSKLLEESVDNRILVNTLEDIEYAVNSLAPKADYLFTDMMSDDYSYRNIAGHLNNTARDQIRPIFSFAITKQSFSKGAFLSNGFNPYIAWRRYYYRINNCYFLLDRLSNYDPISNEERIRATKVRGQCLAIRAYCNFMLVNLFSKQYDEATSDKDLGPPYINRYSNEAVTIFDRISVKQYYEHIESDLLEALQYLDDERANKLYFNNLAIKALLSRLYLYKKDYDNCIRYSEEVLSKNNTVLNIRGLLITYLLNNNQIEEYGKQYFNPSQESYIMVSDDTFQLISYYFHGYYPYPIRSFAQRESFFFGNIGTSPLFDDIIAYKWNYFSNLGSQRLITMLPLFTIAEMKLNLAESYVYKQDFTKAKELIKDVVDYDSYDPDNPPDIFGVADDNTAMINLVLKTRRLRFFCEGMRWFDLKRYKLPITHTMDGNEFKIEGNPDDYVILPPSEEISFRTDY